MTCWNSDLWSAPPAGPSQDKEEEERVAFDVIFNLMYIQTWLDLCEQIISEMGMQSYRSAHALYGQAHGHVGGAVIIWHAAKLPRLPSKKPGESEKKMSGPLDSTSCFDGDASCPDEISECFKRENSECGGVSKPYNSHLIEGEAARKSGRNTCLIQDSCNAVIIHVLEWPASTCSFNSDAILRSIRQRECSMGGAVRNPYVLYGEDISIQCSCQMCELNLFFAESWLLVCGGVIQQEWQSISTKSGARGM